MLAHAPDTKVIVLSGNQERANALKAIALGAYDFHQKPFDADLLGLVVERAFYLHQMQQENRRMLQIEADSPLAGIITRDPGMLKLCRDIERVAPSSATVMLLGDSGSGKELLARALHTMGGRGEHRFVAINCAAIPEELLESELFGHEKGAFTGAGQQTLGKLEMAHGGTFFLDEVGDMALALQAKLLRFLQERVIERLGGRAEIPIDVRIVCATHQDLKALVAARALPRGPVLPAQRDRAADPVAARAQRRQRAAGAPLPQPFLRRAKGGRRWRCRKRRCWRSSSTPGRATCASWNTASGAR